MRGKAVGGVKLTIHLNLVPRSITVGLQLHSPIHLHGAVFKCSAKKTTLPYTMQNRGNHICRLIERPRQVGSIPASYTDVPRSNLSPHTGYA
jgi:hypothetical protein